MTVKKFSHREAIASVLVHIDSYKDSALDLNALSLIARVSKFHFHRVFKEYMGFSLGQYIKLKRLETAIWRFVYTEDKILEIALDSGYENHASFTRAFKKEMGCSPKEFKERFDRDKKIRLSKLHERAPEFLGFQTRAKVETFYVRKTGSYFRSAILAWNDLVGDLKKNGIRVENQTYYGISQDDPNAPDAETATLRFDVCVEASVEVCRMKDELKAKPGEIAGGKFAVFLHQGPLERLSDTYHFIYGKWVHDHEVTLRDIRQFIKYRDPFDAEIQEQDRETEIYLPVD
jgi:AraC family transcriptional regulator